MEDILDKKMGTDSKLDINYIKSLIQEILDKNHANTNKRRIVQHPDRLNIACPICGDSEHHSHKKRGNLYFSNLYYKCFNNDECSRTFTNLLKTFNVDIDLNKKLELYDYLDNHVNYFDSKDVQFKSFDKLFNINELLEFYSNNKTRKITNLQPLQKNSVVYNYVKERRIVNSRYIYEGIFHFTEKWWQPVMVYLNMVNDKVVSMQVRNLLDGDKRFFKIYDFSKIYGELHPEIELDFQEKISYDKLSHFYNIFNIDFTRPVNMFEGYVDSLFMNNSIGMVGLNTDLSFLLKEDGLDIRFIFDNDKPGQNKTKEMLLSGKSVFLWNKFLFDLIKNYRGKKQKTEIYNIIKDIKDFNQLAIKLKRDNIDKLFNFNDYFSSNDMSIYYICDFEEYYRNNLRELKK